MTTDRAKPVSLHATIPPLFFIPHNLPGVWIITSAGLSWAMNKANSSWVRTFYIHTYSRGEGNSSSYWVQPPPPSLSSMNEWRLYWACDGLLLQPTVENMTTQQQVGERGFWDGMGGRSHHQYHHFTHSRLYVFVDVLLTIITTVTTRLKVKGSALARNWGTRYNLGTYAKTQKHHLDLHQRSLVLVSALWP